MVFVGQNFRCTVIQEPNCKYNSSNNIFLPGWMEKICQESSHSLVIDVSTNNYELSAIRLIFSSVPIMKKNTHIKNVWRVSIHLVAKCLG